MPILHKITHYFVSLNYEAQAQAQAPTAEEEDRLGSPQDPRRSTKKSSQSRNTRSSRSEDSDSDQSNSHVLQDSIHQNRQRRREETMAPRTRASKAQKLASKPTTTSTERALEVDVVQVSKRDCDRLEKENQELKEKEAWNQKRASMVVNSEEPGAESAAMHALIKRVVGTELWKVCKFIRNDKFHFKAHKVVLSDLDLREMKGLTGDELKAAHLIWIEKHKTMIAHLLNERRNYVLQQLQTLVRNYVIEGRVDELPTVEEMKKLVYRDGMDSEASKDQKRRMDYLFEKYWDVLMPIVAGNKFWAPKQHWHLLLSFAKKGRR